MKVPGVSINESTKTFISLFFNVSIVDRRESTGLSDEEIVNVRKASFCFVCLGTITVLPFFYNAYYNGQTEVNWVNLRWRLNQSDAKLKSHVTWSPALSRAFPRLRLLSCFCF